ncbi:helix-turn-helix domain-containing protein [bacterium]|nr:helix-turn-helix domain-containing protein [bacterium]
MKKLGELLRTKREERGISIEEAAHNTNIPAKRIKAIEQGDISALPAPIYIRGFVKNLAEYYGIPLEEITPALDEALGREEIRYAKIEPEEITPEEEETVKREKRYFRYILFGVGTLFLIVILARIFSGGKQKPNGEFIEPEEAIRLSATGIAAELSQDILVPPEDINPVWAIGRADSLTLIIKTMGETWLLVEVDYKTRTFKGIVPRGEIRRYRAKNAFFLTIGRPHMVKLWVNGFLIRNIPEKRRRMDLEINRGNVLQLIQERPSQTDTLVEKGVIPSDSTKPKLESRGTIRAE